MKKSELRQIIKEEIVKILKESYPTKFKIGVNEELTSPPPQQVRDFVKHINRDRFFRNIGGVVQVPDDNGGVINIPKQGDTNVYLEIGNQISQDPDFSAWYDKQNKTDEINEKIIDELARQFKIEW